MKPRASASQARRNVKIEATKKAAAIREAEIEKAYANYRSAEQVQKQAG